MDNLKLYSAGAYSFLAIALFIILVLLLIPLLFLGIAGAAFSRLGFSWIEAVAVILLMLAGSLVNIPIHAFRASCLPSGSTGAVVFDAFTGEPVSEARSTVTVSLNLGGAVIPAGVCFYLLYVAGRTDAGAIALPLAGCFSVVALLTFFSATVHPVWGLRAPFFLPAFAALACALLFTGSTGVAAGVTAFAGGTPGVLCGVTARGFSEGIRLGIRQISIGGTGMFGSVFLCAVLSALVA